MAEHTPHTPTPWKTIAPKKAGGALGDYGDVGIDAGGIAIGEMWEHCPARNNPAGYLQNAAANAAFIVRAVNSFEAMREALVRIMALAVADDLPERSSEWLESVADARAALSLAQPEGK